MDLHHLPRHERYVDSNALSQVTQYPLIGSMGGSGTKAAPE